MQNFLSKAKGLAKKIGAALLKFCLAISIIMKKVTDWLSPRLRQARQLAFLFGRKIYHSLSKKEKIALLILIIITVFCSYLLWQQTINKNTYAVPARGGSYTEGMISQKSSDAAQTIDKLTKVGLVRYDNEGNLQPDLAESWEIKEDGKKYIFKIRTYYKAEDAVTVLKNQKNSFQDMEIKNGENNTVEFDLKQSFSPLLDNLTQPLFPYGPYEVQKESKTEIRFRVRKNFYLGQPYIENITLKLYPDEESLSRAFKEKEVDGLAQSSVDKYSRNYSVYEMKLPRWQMVFFNLQKEAFEDKGLRQKLAKNENLGKNFEAVLVTSDKQPYVDEAEKLKARWEPLGLKLNIIARDPLTLKKEVVPARDYDILLYGLDYGRDPDPYPFWHSSQIGENGLNLANFANVDADKILEEGRLNVDAGKRKELYDQFKKILDDEVPAIFLDQNTWKFVVSQKIKGVAGHSGITPADRYNEVWKWWVKEKRVRK